MFFYIGTIIRKIIMVHASYFLRRIILYLKKLIKTTYLSHSAISDDKYNTADFYTHSYLNT